MAGHAKGFSSEKPMEETIFARFAKSRYLRYDFSWTSDRQSRPAWARGLKLTGIDRAEDACRRAPRGRVD